MNDSDLADLTVVGLGYIGLPTAAVFAAGGFTVRGCDIDQDAVESINAGAPHIAEAGLDDLVRFAVSSGALTATTSVGSGDVFIIAVPTPFKDGKKPDLAYVEAAVRSMADHLRDGDLVILESTLPVGATERVAGWLRELRPELAIAGDSSGDGPEPIAIAYCPERVLPGNILHELVHNDRIVGGLTPKCAERAIEFYRQVVKGDCRATDARTAELAKLTENAFRDVNIAFANELSLVADEVDVNVWELIELANLHPRVDILQPGPGVGGHCIAVDPWFIVDASTKTPLIETARRVNDTKPNRVVEQVLEECEGLERPVVACLGLAYKPDIDDLRESPAVEIVKALAEHDELRVLAVEPNIDRVPEALSRAAVEIVLLDDAVDAADVVVGLVAHREILELDPVRLGNKAVVDPAGIFERTRGSSTR